MHAHRNQKRKYTFEPYIVHPVEVAILIMEHAIKYDENQLIAALFHDVVEDTDVTLSEIRMKFQDDVADLVEMVTDVAKPGDGNRASRQLMEVEHLKKASPRAQSIKLADIISNVKSIVENDLPFARVYCKEKLAQVEILTEGDPNLIALARETITQAELTIMRSTLQ